MTTVFLTALWLAPIFILFAGMALLADWLERRYG